MGGEILFLEGVRIPESSQDKTRKSCIFNSINLVVDTASHPDNACLVKTESTQIQTKVTVGSSFTDDNAKSALTPTKYTDKDRAISKKLLSIVPEKTVSQ